MVCSISMIEDSLVKGEGEWIPRRLAAIRLAARLRRIGPVITVTAQV